MLSDAQDLVRVISAAIAANDPLEPWDVVSNFDPQYWDDIAEAIAPGVATARTQWGVRRLLRRALRPLVRLHSRDGYAAERIAAAATEIWRHKTAR